MLEVQIPRLAALARDDSVISLRKYLSTVRRDASELPFEVRPSPMQGLGAFATRAIAAGVRLIEYAGERLTPAESDARYPDVEGERHHTFLFAIDDDVVIDAAVDGNEARWINHSCALNCDAVIEDGVSDRDETSRPKRNSRTTTRTCWRNGILRRPAPLLSLRRRPVAGRSSPRSG